MVVLPAASLLGAVLATGVSPGFEPARIKVVRSPAAAAGAFTAGVPDTPLKHLLRAPFAVIARISHTGPESGRFRIAVDGVSACETELGGGSRRIDCVSAAAAPRQVDIHGPSSFTVEYLELATHHGMFTVPQRVWIVPEGAAVGRVHWAFALLAAIASFVFLWHAPATPLTGWWRTLHRAVAGLACTLGIGIIVVPLVSPYSLITTVTGWVGWVTVLAAPRAFALLRARRIGAPAIVSMVILLFAAFAVIRVVDGKRTAHHDGNHSGMLHIERARFDRHPLLQHRPDVRATLALEEVGGYDAQMMYFMAFDPWLRHVPGPDLPVIDAPAYRYGRSGFVWLVKAVTFNDWRRYAAAMVYLPAAAIVAFTLLLLALARQYGASPWWALSALAVPGFWRSAFVALPEPIAAVLAGTAIYFFLRDRWWLAAAVCSAAILVRETTAIVAIAAALTLLRRDNWRTAVIFLVIAAAPILLWRAYIGVVLWDRWGMDAVMFDPRTHALPLAGMLDAMRDAWTGAYQPGGAWQGSRAVRWLPLLLLASFAVSLVLVVRERSVATIAGAIYGFAAICLTRDNVWADPVNVERTTYEVFALIAIATVLRPARSRPMNIMLGLYWAACAAYVLFGNYDAEFIRGRMFWL